MRRVKNLEGVEEKGIIQQQLRRSVWGSESDDAEIQKERQRERQSGRKQTLGSGRAQNERG